MSDEYSGGAKIESIRDEGNALFVYCLGEDSGKKITLVLTAEAKELIAVGDRIVLGYCDCPDDDNVVMAFNKDGKILPFFG